MNSFVPDEISVGEGKKIIVGRNAWRSVMSGMIDWTRLRILEELRKKSGSWTEFKRF